ncbi:hypothetical protein [Acrocarpospora pleiomorpha]|nr:hypothetical protein [Acrocarpospora pleiomorpha]
MSVLLTSRAWVGNVDEEVRLGALRLPQIVPGGDGYYFPYQYDKGSDHEGHTGAKATLVRGDAALIISIIRGPQGRDPGADVVALMKLIGPKLTVAASPPSPSPAKGD